MFLAITLVLSLSCLLIYSIVMVVMPQSYRTESNERFIKDSDALIETLKSTSYAESIKQIHDFCLENNAVATLEGSRNTINFGNIEDFSMPDDERVKSSGIVSILQFPDSRGFYTLTLLQHLKIVNEITQIFIRLSPYIGLLILVLSGCSAALCARLLAKPVLQITSVANQMANLDLSGRIEVNRSDELGNLSESLNTMAENLEDTMIHLEEANKKLVADIEQERAQEKQRRDFFAAASHELKTPITIAKGQLESMIYGIGDYKNHEKYLPMTLQTMERMEALVKELLMVTKLSNEDFHLHKSCSNMKVLLESVLNSYQLMMEEKQIRLHLDLQEDVILYVDPVLFKKVYSNVLRNAILYSPPKALITITLHQDVFTITNSDAHIPEDQLKHVFHALYRVEQSRNSSTGGSGLGLYIVKNIVDLHHMDCRIENKEAGVTFTLFHHTEQNK